MVGSNFLARPSPGPTPEMAPEPGAQFECGTCNASFSLKSDLIDHNRNFCGGTDWKCRDCGEGFKTQATLEQHKSMAGHGSTIGQLCESCKIYYPTADLFEQHQRSPGLCHAAWAFKLGHQDRHGAYGALGHGGPVQVPGRATQLQHSNEYSRTTTEDLHTPQEERIAKEFYCNICNLSLDRRQSLLHYQATRHISSKMQLTVAQPKANPLPEVTVPSIINVSRATETSHLNRIIMAHEHPEASATGTSGSNHGWYCDVCQKDFKSEALYDRHWLGCRPPSLRQVAPVAQSRFDIPTVATSPEGPSSSQDTQSTLVIALPAQQSSTMVLGHDTSAVSGKEGNGPGASALPLSKTGLTAAMGQLSLYDDYSPVPNGSGSSHVLPPTSARQNVAAGVTGASVAAVAAASSEALAPVPPVPSLQKQARHVAMQNLQHGLTIAQEGSSETAQKEAETQGNRMPGPNDIQGNRAQKLLSNMPAATGSPSPHRTQSALYQERTPAPQDLMQPRQTPKPSSNKASQDTPTLGLKTLECSVRGCAFVARSEAGLKVHKQDAHGIDGRAVDLDGRDSWMLTQRARAQRQNEAAFATSTVSSSTNPSRGRGDRRNGTHRTLPTTNTSGHGAPKPIQPRQTLRYGGNASQEIPSPLRNRRVSRQGRENRLQCATFNSASPAQTSALPIGPPPVVPLVDMNQAWEIWQQILKLKLQADLSIHPAGTLNYRGVDFVRIAVDKQIQVQGMLETMCHLPKILQRTEYLPTVTAFKVDHQATYPVEEFELSPARDASKRIHSIVAVNCSKIILANGLQEAVKVTAIDVLSCQVLVNYLLCTDPNVGVQAWRTSVTGLSSFSDIETARQTGYKVLKGWKAARAALWQFIDNDTIILGHDLRADFDTLRMIHGRGIDIAKVVEKAAGAPLSSAQLQLHNLCRDLCQIHLPTHLKFGRDPLHNAYAIRELILWVLKNTDKLSKWAKAKAADYARIGGR